MYNYVDLYIYVLSSIRTVVLQILLESEVNFYHADETHLCGDEKRQVFHCLEKNEWLLPLAGVCHLVAL